MFDSLIRGLPRILIVAVAAVALLLIAHLPELAGIRHPALAVLAPLCFGLGITLLGLAFGDAALRVMQPGVDAQHMAHSAAISSQGAGLVYLGRAVLAAVVMILTVTASRAAEPPASAGPLLPLLHAEQSAHWPDMPLPSALGAQVEQETCPSLKHRSCWNPRAELRTSREQGVGLGQLTRAFRADGSTRFDALAEIVRAYPRELAGLSWDRPYDAKLQLRALVLKDRQGFRQVAGAATPADQLAMAFSAYNGGLGGLASDRRVCAATPACDAARWFGHVERTSLKAKAAVPGYGQSFFEINREYVRNVMVMRRPRYLSLEAYYVDFTPAHDQAQAQAQQSA